MQLCCLNFPHVLYIYDVTNTVLWRLRICTCHSVESFYVQAIKDDTSSVASEDSIVVDANPTERFPPLPLNNVNSHNVYNDSVPKNNDTESYHLKEASEISDGKKLSDSHTENGFGDATSEVADNNVALSQATLDNEVKILASSTEVKDDLAYETRNTEEVSDNLPPDEAGPTTSNSSVTVDPQTGLNNDLVRFSTIFNVLSSLKLWSNHEN